MEPKLHHVSDTLAFDHCYQKIRDESDYARIQSLGFTIFERIAEHPFSLLSRIILIGPPQTDASPRTSYLELCWIRDIEGELAHVRATEPGTTEDDLFMPGLSFRTPDSLQDFLPAKSVRWAALQPRLWHRNYDWTEGEDERRPGWNFLDFETPPVPGVHVWLTEYEPRPASLTDAASIERHKASSVHANGVNAFKGLILDVSEAQKNALSDVTGANWHDGRLALNDGTVILSHHAHPEFRSLLADKRSPFKAVNLGCESLRQFSEVSGIEPLSGRSTIHIPSANPESWDIMVTEGG